MKGCYALLAVGRRTIELVSGLLNGGIARHGQAQANPRQQYSLSHAVGVSSCSVYTASKFIRVRNLLFFSMGTGTRLILDVTNNSY